MLMQTRQRILTQVDMDMDMEHIQSKNISISFIQLNSEVANKIAYVAVYNDGVKSKTKF